MILRIFMTVIKEGNMAEKDQLLQNIFSRVGQFEYNFGYDSVKAIFVNDYAWKLITTYCIYEMQYFNGGYGCVGRLYGYLTYRYHDDKNAPDFYIGV